MEEWWNALTGVEQFYWTIAIASSIVFIFVFIINLIVGFDSDTDMDGDMDMDVDLDGDVDTDIEVTLFSVKGLTAFFTFFGWAGVLFLNDGKTVTMSTVYALIAGGMALALVGYLMNIFANMGESGNISLQDALDKEGEVYLTIPAGISGKGKVQLELGGGVKEIDAVTDEGEIKTGSKILVTDIIDKETILVKVIREE